MQLGKPQKLSNRTSFNYSDFVTFCAPPTWTSLKVKKMLRWKTFESLSLERKYHKDMGKSFSKESLSFFAIFSAATSA